MMKVACLSFKVGKMMTMTMICILTSCCHLFNFDSLHEHIHLIQIALFSLQHYIISAGNMHVYFHVKVTFCEQLFKCKTMFSETVPVNVRLTN